jgi:hypothetical protein
MQLYGKCSEQTYIPTFICNQFYHHMVHLENWTFPFIISLFRNSKDFSPLLLKDPKLYLMVKLASSVLFFYFLLCIIIMKTLLLCTYCMFLACPLLNIWLYKLSLRLYNLLYSGIQKFWTLVLMKLFLACSKKRHPVLNVLY